MGTAAVRPPLPMFRKSGCVNYSSKISIVRWVVASVTDLREIYQLLLYPSRFPVVD